ncbi:MAG: hypothetical protein AAF548_14400 [Actinomycetota bacterium]
MTEQCSEVAREVEEWLLGLAAASSPRGEGALELARALDHALDHPHRAAPGVHIVGTAGKGTLAALLTHHLVASGLSVATHQSPHVFDVRERFLLDGALPADEPLAAAFVRVRDAVAEVRSARGRAPTFFAVTAALSWELGRRAGVDAFITEAGIGGRLDATAVLDRPDTITAVTHIGLDHTDVLGSTVREIAREKAAVFAGRHVAVLGPQSSPEAVEVVRAVARQAGVGLREVHGGEHWRADALLTGRVVAEEFARLTGRSLAPPSESIMPPGRSQEHHIGGRVVVLDGAHNALKLDALAAGLGDARPAVALVAIGAGKDLEGCAAALAALACPVVATEFIDSAGPRSHPASALADALAAAGADVVARPRLHDAATSADELAGVGGRILVTGSFLVLAPAIGALRAIA